MTWYMQYIYNISYFFKKQYIKIMHLDLNIVAECPRISITASGLNSPTSDPIQVFEHKRENGDSTTRFVYFFWCAHVAFQLSPSIPIGFGRENPSESSQEAIVGMWWKVESKIGISSST